MRHVFLGLFLVIAAVAATFVTAAVFQQRATNRMAAPEPMPARDPAVERPYSRPLGEPRRGRPYIPGPDDLHGSRGFSAPVSVVVSTSSPASD